MSFVKMSFKGFVSRNKDHWMAQLICLAAVVIYGWLVVYKYIHLSYYDWDLAFFTQAAWNLLHGSQYSSLVGINYFGDHSYFFTFLILPIFAIFPHPLTLVFLKIIAFVASAYLLYKILRRDLGQGLAAALMTVYLFFPANLFAIIYEFNIEAFAPVFLLLVYDYYKRGKYSKFIVSAFFLCLIKENMLLIVFMFGLHALWAKKKEAVKWGWMVMAVSLVLFLVLVMWVIPHFRHLEQHAFWVRYQHVLDKPWVFFSKIVMANLGYVGDLFGVLILPIFLFLKPLFFFVPIFIQHLVSNEFAEHTIYYHYGPTMTPFIFLAASGGLMKIKQSFNARVFRSLFILFCILCVGHVVRFYPAINKRVIAFHDNQDKIRWLLIKEIPKDQGVIAGFDFLAPLATRRSLYSFHKIYDEFYQDPAKIKKGELYDGKIFQLPVDVSYALIDWDEPFLKRALKNRPDLTNQKVNEFMGNWDVVKQQGSIVLLKRKSSE